MFSYFTTSTANEILPQVIEKFNFVLECKNDVMKAEQELQVGLSNNNKLPEYAALKLKLDSKMTGFYQAIEDLESTGVLIKSIEEGLLDFPAKRFDEEIWLCWKHGETEIKFWHELDVGFIGRKPIEVDDKTLV